LRVSLATGRGPSLSTYETTPGGNAGAPGDVVPGHRHGLLLSADVVRQRISRRLTTLSGSTAVQPSIQRLFGQGVGVRLHVEHGLRAGVARDTQGVEQHAASALVVL